MVFPMPDTDRTCHLSFRCFQLPANGFLYSQYEVRINAFLIDQLFVPALLNDLPVVDDQYLIRIPHRL